MLKNWEEIEKDEFISKARKRYSDEEINFIRGEEIIYAHLKSFENVVAHSTNYHKKDVKIRLWEELWNFFSFLRDNQSNLGKGPKKDLNFFIREL